ncbi:Mitochondrial-processing peptidase subunit alpha, partial [Zancudomyces culisetae]
MVTRTLYNPWEFDAVKSTVQFESKLASSCATTLLTEKLHNVAFRSGLGNSLYAEFPAAITSSKQVKEYAASNLGTDTVSIVGTGIETAKLVELLSAGPLAKVSGAS